MIWYDTNNNYNNNSYDDDNNDHNNVIMTMTNNNNNKNIRHIQRALTRERISYKVTSRATMHLYYDPHSARTPYWHSQQTSARLVSLI